MSRRGRASARGNAIRGPTSALTDFLRDAGITQATIARRAATQQQQPAAAAAGAAAGPSNATPAQPAQAQNAGASAPSTPSRRPTRAAASRRTSGYGSDNLDEDDDEEGTPMDEDAPMEEVAAENPEEGIAVAAPTKKLKLSKAAEAKRKTQEKKAKGKKGQGDDDSDYSDDDPFTTLSKSMWTNSNPRPAPGSFENCARCQKQFTVTKYTLAANPPPGWLCHICAKSSGQDPFKKPAVPRKRKAPADKRTITHFIENRLPSLVNLCIKVITRYIDDVESLGDIGSMNLEAIAKAMSKTRTLTPENAKLFYSTTNPNLRFYDATNITPAAFESLAYLNPNLTNLRIDFCGQLDDNAFKVFSTSLPSLRRIELLGPFLVRVPTWKIFAKSHPNLEGFLITQSPRFDLDCMKALVKHCPGLTELRLKEFGKMEDDFLAEIASLALTYLDISCPGNDSCGEEAVIELLEQIGGTLRSLNLAKHDALTDDFLKQGLLPHVRNLEALDLSHLYDLTDEGVAEFFGEWENPPLLHLDVSRNSELKGKAVEGIMMHSGQALEVLNINGAKDVEESALRTIGRLGKALKKVDVGFCRELDDFVVKAWLEGAEFNGAMRGGCPQLEELKVWGCNKLTAMCPRKAGVVIHGVESHIIRMN